MTSTKLMIQHLDTLFYGLEWSSGDTILEAFGLSKGVPVLVKAHPLEADCTIKLGLA